ncbi:cell division protein FtsK [Methylorubrum populi]|uniref:DNA translocase FtsK n=2 Tax=Methylobacteriaceae TaxID=119045 RepID=UPI002F2C252A
MRASGRPPYSHRDPSRPSRGGDRLDRSIGGFAHRLMSLRSNLARRIAGTPPAPPRALPQSLPHPALPQPGVDAFDAGSVPSWLVPPGAMLGRAPAAAETWTAEDERGLYAAGMPGLDPRQAFPPEPAYDGLPESTFESRIDPRASGPGVLVRTPRRPAAIAPEAGALPLHGEQHLIPFSIDIDSEDWKRNTPAQVIDRVMGRLDALGRGIILLHDIQPRTVAILPELLRQLKAARPPAPPVAAQPVSVPAQPAPQAPSPAQAMAPLTIPARPVLLRTKVGAEAEVAEEAAEETAQDTASDTASNFAHDFEAEAEVAIETVSAQPVAAEPENRPRAILPERPTLIPAGRHLEMSFVGNADYSLPSLELLAEPPLPDGEEVDADELEQNALNLQQTVQDFGVRGDILAVRPGPVVTLYELEPAPGTKSSRVIGLSDDIARSMSAVSARVAVVPGRNVIGIELPNPVRETVYLRELLASVDFVETKHKLALCLGKNIGGEPIIADLARMPHLLVAGTTGSGKSVAINTMILSLLYRLKPEECRLIMVDPKMLELSVYDGIPHLLSPVVIDPKKAVIALKWAVREMEERYKKMSKISVRNIDGYNARMKEARERGEIITRTVQTGFDRTTGEAVFEEQEMDLSALPYIVIVVDEMADLMMVAGKDIEGAIQRLAQMARAAGIHLIMATQRPSVDVITGTIKANFPTRISFQVTSKIDSRTILGEMGAEQLLGQGDMLFMAGGGRTTRVHGPFCSDSEVESVVAHLKRQGRPSYLEAVTADDGSSEQPEKPAKGSKAAKAEKDDFAEAEEADAPVFDIGAFAASAGAEGGELYEQAIAVVLRDRKASTSYIQRRLQIGYNRAASIMERMEIEGIVGPANHAGKREILVEGLSGAPSGGYDDE